MQANKRSEYRSIKFETRVEKKEEGGKKLVLRGYPIVFNTETRIFDFWNGDIRETILPTALDGTDLTNVYLITGHNIEPDKVLGRAGVNMRIEVDETGLFFECELPNTEHARDMYNLVESGIIDGMSFGFSCSDEVNPETKTRTITHIDELFEVSITPFPAYKEASVIAHNQDVKRQEKVEAADEQKKQEEDEAKKAEIAKKEQEIKELEESLND
ncbi:MAG: HK97 family phage prohead protease [Clostridia bacterium]|nr:HK97 family phage prohead protease [Clostridia bacterium]